MSTQAIPHPEAAGSSGHNPPQEHNIPLDVKELLKGPALGALLMEAAKHKIEDAFKNDQQEPGQKKGQASAPSEPIGHVSLNLNKHLPPAQVNLHSNQAPTASFVQQHPLPQQQQAATAQIQHPVQQTPGPGMIDLGALLGMFCGGRPESHPTPAPHLNNQAPTVLNAHTAPETQNGQTPAQNLQQNTQPQPQQSSGIFGMGFLKNLPFVGSGNSNHSEQPAVGGQTLKAIGQASSKAPLVFHRPEGGNEKELVLLPSRSTQAGSQDAGTPPPPVVVQPTAAESQRAPFQPTVAAGTQQQVPQQQQPAPFIDLGSLLGMFCGGHNQNHPQQAGATGTQPNQRQGFSLNFFRNFSFTNQQQQQPSGLPAGAQLAPGADPQASSSGQHPPGTNLAAVGSQLLSSIEYRQNQGVSLNLGTLVGGVQAGDVYSQLQLVQQENAQMKERISQLEQERETYTLPAVNIGIDFEGYQTLVKQVNAYCKEFQAELTQAQLDYVHLQLKQAFDDRLANLFKEIKFNTREDLERFLSQSTKTLSSLKSVHADLSSRLSADSGVLQPADKQRLLQPLELQICSLEMRIGFFAAPRVEGGEGREGREREGEKGVGVATQGGGGVERSGEEVAADV